MNIKQLIKTNKIYGEAFTHSSYANENNIKFNYERLEFLGDSILNFVVAEYLFLNYNLPEGELSKKRASFVCEDALIHYSNSLNLKKYIKIGQMHKNNVIDSISADIFESLVGAIYIDKGIKEAKKFIYEVVIPHIKNDKTFFNDYKSIIQEIFKEKEISYIVTKETGKDHNKTFYVDLSINNIIYGSGVGKTIKEAEQAAAKKAHLKKVG